MFEFQLLFFYKNLSTIGKAKVDHLQKELVYLFEEEPDNTVAQRHLYRKNIVFSLPFCIHTSNFPPLPLHFSHGRYFIRRYIYDIMTRNINEDFSTLVEFLKQWKIKREIVLYFKPYFHVEKKNNGRIRGELFYKIVFTYGQHDITCHSTEDEVLKHLLECIAYHRYGFYVYEIP